MKNAMMLGLAVAVLSSVGFAQQRGPMTQPMQGRDPNTGLAFTNRPSDGKPPAKEWIDKMSVKCRAPEQAIGELSGGNQQKVAIARLLYHDVDVLMFDEPTRGIDVGSKEQIYSVIDKLALQGKAVLVVSSYLPELLGICDRIAVMHKGQLGEARPVSLCSQESIMMEATRA